MAVPVIHGSEAVVTIHICRSPSRKSDDGTILLLLFPDSVLIFGQKELFGNSDAAVLFPCPMMIERYTNRDKKGKARNPEGITAALVCD
jgi:hypothetical protein